MALTNLLIALSMLLFTGFPGVTSDSFIDQQLPTVAVWDLVNLNPAEDIGVDMGELLAVMVIETLSESGTFQIVERERLILVLKELNLSSVNLVDQSTRLRIGRIAGARFMVFGSYFVQADKMRVDLRMVEVETGSIVKATQKTTSADDLHGWLKNVREAAQELIYHY